MAWFMVMDPTQHRAEEPLNLISYQVNYSHLAVTTPTIPQILSETKVNLCPEELEVTVQQKGTNTGFCLGGWGPSRACLSP